MAERATLATAIGIALACAVVLSAVHGLTAKRIHHNETSAARAHLLELVPTDAMARGWSPDTRISPARWMLLDGTVLVRSNVPGYGGPMRLLYRFGTTIGSTESTDGTDNTDSTDSTGPARLLGFILLGHQETPGITDFLQETDGWLSRLAGSSARDLALVDTVSGATITTRALRDHLSRTLQEVDPAPGGPQPPGGYP